MGLTQGINISKTYRSGLSRVSRQCKSDFGAKELLQSIITSLNRVKMQRRISILLAVISLTTGDNYITLFFHNRITKC